METEWLRIFHHLIFSFPKERTNVLLTLKYVILADSVMLHI
jgi:hypothetical protein